MKKGQPRDCLPMRSFIRLFIIFSKQIQDCLNQFQTQLQFHSDMRKKTNPYSLTGKCKQNVCPNSKLSKNSCHIKGYSPSIQTHSQHGLSMDASEPLGQINYMSRSDEIQQNDSDGQNQKIQQNVQEISLCRLVAQVLGVESVSIDEVVTFCEEYHLTCKTQLLSLLKGQEPVREWPQQLKILLLSDLGEVIVQQIGLHWPNQHRTDQPQIMQLLIPNPTFTPLSSETLLDAYHDFKIRNSQQSNQAQSLKQSFQILVQKKVSQITDKVIVLKMQKQAKKYSQNGRLTFTDLVSVLQMVKFQHPNCILTFKYLHYLETNILMAIVDRSKTISVHFFIQELFQSSQHQVKNKIHPSFVPNKREEENNLIIKQLLKEKQHLLDQLQRQQKVISDLQLKQTLNQIQSEKHIQQMIERTEMERKSEQEKYLKNINLLKEQNYEKDSLIEWYKQQLESIISLNKNQKHFKSNRVNERNAISGKNHC